MDGVRARAGAGLCPRPRPPSDEDLLEIRSNLLLLNHKAKRTYFLQVFMQDLFTALLNSHENPHLTWLSINFLPCNSTQAVL